MACQWNQRPARVEPLPTAVPGNVYSEKMHRLFWGVVTMAASAAVVSLAQGTKSIWSGIYTEAQATAGEALYGDHCANCHGDDLAGIERAPAVAGGTFVQTWHGASLKKLFERIELMPPEKPKSLTPKHYVDLLAYLLSANRFPAGPRPLELDRSALAGIVITSSRPK